MRFTAVTDDRRSISSEQTSIYDVILVSAAARDSET